MYLLVWKYLLYNLASYKIWHFLAESSFGKASRDRIFKTNRLYQQSLEVDETLVGGVSHRHGNDGKLHKHKSVVLVAIELIEPKGFERISLKRVDSATKENIQQFIFETVKLGSKIYSDGSLAYVKLGNLGYQHQRTVQTGSDIPAHISMVGVHRVSSLLKRWILGTYQGAVREKQLDYYLVGTEKCAFYLKKYGILFISYIDAEPKSTFSMI